MKTVRADHVGSLLRPPELLEARAAHSEGKLPLEVLRALEDRAVLDAVQKQHEIGLDVLSDGEFRRGSWLSDMAEAVEGFVPQKVMLEWKGPGGATEASAANAVGARLRKIRRMSEGELPMMQRLAPGEFKVTLPAPSNFMQSSYKRGLTEQFYPTHADLLHDLVEIVRDEVDWLVHQGVTYIQFDAPFYSHYLDPRRGQSEKHLEAAIEADNACFKDVPSRVTKALHICRGNNRSRWYAEGGYDTIAEKLFATADVDRFLLEFDDERSGSFEPLTNVPAGKTVVLGLITTKSSGLEPVDELRRRVDEASRFVPLENLALSPQCGFASVASGNLISSDVQWRKLQLVVETARKIWG